MTSRAEKIDQIIASRKPIAEKTAQTVEHLKAVSASLEQFKGFLPKVSEKIDNAEQKNAIESLRPDFDRCLTLSSDCQTKLRQIELRFDRYTRTFNIGVTGNAGIGKSTLLQHLTGLSDDLIPARDPKNPMGGSCTGAPSVIVNNTDNDRTYANVEFYSEPDFFEEIIKPYYRALDTEQRWLPSPSNFYDFANNPLPSLPDEFSNNRTQNIYDALKFRQEHAKQYQKDFGRRLSKLENTDEIRRYVAQKDKNNNPITDWIPVKMVTIYCPFRGKDGGHIKDRISVCDTPGLGDIGCKADDNLMSNIAENIDAVWMLNLVTSNSQIVKDSDSALYTLIGDAVPEWKPQEWVYGVINSFTGTTQQQVDVFKKELEKRHIITRKVYDLDVRQPEEVLATFDSTLNAIAENQKALDEKLSQARFKDVEKLVGEIQTLVEKAKGLIKNLVVAGNPGSITLMFQDCWGDVAVALNVLVANCKNTCGEQDNGFIAKLKEIEEQEMKRTVADPKDPGTIKIIKIVGLPQWFADKQRELRIDLSMAFDTLDKISGSLSFDKLRQDTVDILKKKGKLATVFDSEIPEEARTDTTRWLQILAEQIRENQNGGKIARSIEMFYKASYSFRGNMLHRVRETFGVLDSNDPQSEIYAFSPGDTIEDVCEKLKVAYEKAVSDCCTALRKLAQEPNNARYAAIGSFTDVCCGAMWLLQNVWEKFYEQHAGEVWSEMFSKFTENSKLKQDWDNEIKKLEIAAGLLKH